MDRYNRDCICARVFLTNLKHYLITLEYSLKLECFAIITEKIHSVLWCFMSCFIVLYTRGYMRTTLDVLVY